MRSHALVLAVAISFLPAAAAQDPAPDLSGVDAAIERGVGWLLSVQEADGSWRGPQPERYHGMTALAVYTLLKCGLPPTHPAVRAGVACVRARPCERTYDLGVSLMMEHALGEARDQPRVKRLADLLVATIGNGKRTSGARWGYPGEWNGSGYLWTDLSNTQYAILGLRAARESGYRAGSKAFWEEFARQLLDAQAAYGSFSYGLAEKPSASMTCAGVTCLVVTMEVLGGEADLGLQGKMRAAVNLGLDWLDKNWAVDTMIDLRQKDSRNDRWMYYWLYGLERLAAFARLEKIGARAWYPEGAASILSRQHKDGHWLAGNGDKGDDDTCFALLFLRRGSQSTAPAPRSRSQAAAASAAFLIAASGDNPVNAWIREAGPELDKRLSQGASPRKLVWLVGDDAVATVEPIASVKDLYGGTCALRHRADRNGVHRLRARLSLAWADGRDAGVLESNALEVRVDDVEESWQREAREDAGRNLVDPAAVTVSASSFRDDARTPARAADGHFGTHWLCGLEDADPWIEVVLDRQVPANVLKLGHAVPYAERGGRYARARDVEVRVNDEPAFLVRLDAEIRHKQWIRLGGRPVHKLRLRVRSVERIGDAVSACGFSEIELESVKDARADDVDRFCPAMEVLVPASRHDAQAWRYTLDAPGDGWADPAFRDERWPQGKSAFGNLAFALTPERTAWKSAAIWMRREFSLPKGEPGEVQLEVHHDDDVEIWINGVAAASASGTSSRGYRLLRLSDDARASLRPGRNLIAVTCRNTGGPGVIDVSVVRLLPSAKPPAKR